MIVQVARASARNSILPGLLFMSYILRQIGIFIIEYIIS